MTTRVGFVLCSPLDDPGEPWHLIIGQIEYAESTACDTILFTEDPAEATRWETSLHAGLVPSYTTAEPDAPPPGSRISEPWYPGPRD